MRPLNESQLAALEKLGSLRQREVISDSDFAAEKEKILAVSPEADPEPPRSQPAHRNVIDSLKDGPQKAGIGNRVKAGIAGVLVLAIVAAVVTLIVIETRGSEDSPPPISPPPISVPLLMKDYHGCTLQDAQDSLRGRFGIFSAPKSDDLGGNRRPWLDRLWIDHTQQPQPGTPITSETDTRVGILKVGEREPEHGCLRPPTDITDHVHR